MPAVANPAAASPVVQRDIAIAVPFPGEDELPVRSAVRSGVTAQWRLSGSVTCAGDGLWHRVFDDPFLFAAAATRPTVLRVRRRSGGRGMAGTSTRPAEACQTPLLLDRLESALGRGHCWSKFQTGTSPG